MSYSSIPTSTWNPGIPTANLISPSNGNITNSATVNFTCNATDEEMLANITFYWNYSGTWQSNETVNLIGTSNQTTFTKTNLNNGAVLWNCRACDNASQCSFGTANWTVTVNYTAPDTTPPATVTNLINRSQTSSSIYWNWTNPADSDFNHTEVWINETFYANVYKPANYYNATGLQSNTTYQIQTRTADHRGNINSSWVNSTSRTVAQPASTLSQIIFAQGCAAEDQSSKGAWDQSKGYEEDFKFHPANPRSASNLS